MRIALVKMSSMGDVIHALPVVTDILAHLPQARIDWVVEEAFVPIARLHPGVVEIVPIALRRWRRQLRTRAGWADLRAGVTGVRRRLRSADYDLVLDLQGLLKSAVVARWAKAPVAGLDRACAREPIASLFYSRRFAVDQRRHAIERLRELAGHALGYSPCGLPRFALAAPAPGPELLRALEAAAGAQGSGLLVFLHATSRAEKLWPEAEWIHLLRAARARGRAVVLPWGNDVEREAAERLVASAGHGAVLPRLGLDDCAALLAAADGVVGVDTGLMHLAAALERPTVALFAATPAWRFGPYWTPRARSLGEPGHWPSAQEAESTLSELIAAQPA